MRKTLSVIGLLVLFVSLSIGQVSSTTGDYPTNEACGAPFPVGRVPTGVVAGDFNNDSLPDIAVANSGSNTVTVLCFDSRNKPSFGTPKEIEVGIGPRALAVGDFNNDGNQDLVVANEHSNDTTLLLGDGRCSFPGQNVIAGIGNGPIALAVGDFGDAKRDGQQDFAVANQISNNVAVYINGGTVSHVPVGNNPSSITVSDFNADGIQDFVVTNRLDNNIYVCLGDPGTTLSFSCDEYTVGLFPVSVAPSFGWGYTPLIYSRLLKPMITDFNRDHCPDIVVANHGEQNQSNSISVLLGERTVETQQVEGYTFTRFVCTGEFKPAINYQTDGNGPSSVVVGQFNGDSMQDIAVVNQKSNSLTIFLAQCCEGKQCFEAQCCTRPRTDRADTCKVTFKIVKKYVNVCHKPVGDKEVPCDPYQMVVLDKNRDGIDDLAITCKNSAHPQEESVVIVMEGLGDGKFCARGNEPPVADAGPDKDVSIGDTVKLDGTGSYDPEGAPLTYSWQFVSNPDDSKATLEEPETPAPKFVPDVKGQYKLKLTVSDGELDDSDQVVITAGNTAAEVGKEPTSVAVADFNGDGLPDLAVVNQKSNDVTIILGRGEGALALVSRYDVGESPSEIVAGDFNLDGFVDIAVTDVGINMVSVRLGKGNGFFQEERQFPVGVAPMGIAAGDFNEDEKLDLAVANSGGGISVLLGEGNGEFKEQSILEAGDSPEAITVADLDQDKCLDLAVANFTSNDVSVLPGNCDGTFGAQARFQAGGSPKSIAIGDFNDDNKLDLVVTNFSANDVSVLLGNGDGSFQPQQRFEVGSSPRSVAIGQFTSDVALDLAVANYGSDDVSILVGAGRGEFRRIRGFAVGDQPTDIAVGDFNTDGIDDLVIVNSCSNTVWVMLGRGDGSFYDC